MLKAGAGLAILTALGLASATPVAAQEVALFESGRVVAIVHDPQQPLALVSQMVARDLQQVTGKKPRLSSSLDDCQSLCVVIGQRGSPLIEAVSRDTGLDLTALEGQWERYGRGVLASRSHPSRRYLVIAGSDTRGAIWGAVDLTRDMGVSAWEWWADVTPRRVERLTVDGAWRLSSSPSVQYRGIFLNDEDWGLQPWAAKTFEPETGDIGPKTYARIFELMWRLKANLIWPAMHDSTKPFYQIPGNAETAKAYAIVVGTSHAEPMMRNNVREWDDAKRGDFNFFAHRDAMVDYWRERAQEVKDYENIYTIGLRGKHDTGMEGAKTPEMARDTLTEVMSIQRDLLSQAQKRPASQIPQALTLYKEVLDIYATGLKVPDDVTLVWPEDNYGYINQLSTPQEQARGGGSGVYYHISYWGRPHDYLWLATTHPALIREQMDRAWQMDARKIWVVNVGDIKPGEYLTQYFLDLAFDHNQFGLSARDHLSRWARAQFGPEAAEQIADIMGAYYDLAFERRPEFMGFNQVEPITPVAISDYVRSGGQEAQRRIALYTALAARAEALEVSLPADRRAAYFQLVLYPVRSAARLNERNLKLDLAALYTRQGRPSANLLSEEARQAHAGIVEDTHAYNEQLGGKWRGIMDMAPRGLPVFQEPAYPMASFATKPGCDIDSSELTFVRGRPASHALTLYSWGMDQEWTLSGLEGLTPGARHGRLSPANGFSQRIDVTYDGRSTIGPGAINCGATTAQIAVKLVEAADERAPVEINRIVSITAANVASVPTTWERVEGLGSRGAVLRSRLSLSSRDDWGEVAPLDYDFELSDGAGAELRIIGLPAHPLTSANRLRLAVQIDDEAAKALDFETRGRSDEWKRNVLTNSAERRIALPKIAKGRHRIRVYALDPGFLLDRLDVRLNGAPDFYGPPPVR